MPSITTSVGAGVGLHARPAATFVQAAARTGLKIGISRPDQPPVPADSLLRVLTLGIRTGEPVLLTCDEDGPAADAALASLAELLRTAE
ncbi:HPr family phosphocarrier protein [Streptomyces sp. MAR4 CNX-425]|uniref:HPr family phosphocarrier protein n=1 Tax=Streptomyces sp. MAR4 CNX-425 TaxID=3406343 RepID=UPI003B513086